MTDPPRRRSSSLINKPELRASRNGRRYGIQDVKIESVWTICAMRNQGQSLKIWSAVSKFFAYASCVATAAISLLGISIGAESYLRERLVHKSGTKTAQYDQLLPQSHLQVIDNVER